MKPSEYITYDAMGLAELVRKKKVSASELVNAALARADALNTELNAIVVRRDEAVRAEAAPVDDSVRARRAPPPTLDRPNLPDPDEY